MDAQNAVENASTKPTTASPKQTGLEPSQQQQQQQPKSALSRKSPTAVRSSPPVKEAKSHIKDDDGGADANSEAETIVLPDKNGQHSPAKTRKVIKHEAKSDAEDGAAADPPSRKLSSAGKSTIGKGKDAREAKDARDGRDGRDAHEGGEKSQKPPSSASGRDGTVAGSLNTAAAAAAAVAKKKRLHTVASQDKQRTKAECSSGLSSAPASPPPQGQAASHNHREQQPLARRRRLSNAARSAASDSDSIRAQSPKPPSVAKETSRSIEKLVPHKRKAPKAESEDDADSHKARRQRTSNVGSGDSTKASRDHHGSNHGAANKSSSAKSHQDPHGHGGPHPVKSASPPPPPRSHRRSISTQLPSQSANGLSHKKKRVPAPLQSTGYHSDESSGGGGSPRIRSSKLRSLVTPATTESNISPAKMAPHKKHLDAHGQTFLARACARGEYEIAKQRLGERPEDLNVADFAGNTPLQIASINGYEEIVKLLLEAGCALDCVNYDKDTPLLDAVENGHVNVVKLLLDAGVNPRKANLNGEEPLDLITKDTDNGDEIRQLLVDAKQRMGERRRTSEEHAPKQQDGRDSHGPESPRRSPAATTSNNAAASGRRSGTVRATKTSNHLLYMPMDDKTLRQAAGRGDEETVTRILQVRESFDDPESMVAAARGGHDMIINLLLALGGASPDPAPVASMSAELATPMLAAIGQENIKVVELLLSQAKFDPTRKFKGETYYEIARRRQGTNWKEEEHILKDAYDAHKRSQKDSVKNKSPPAREPERDAKRGARSEPKDKPEARDSRDESSKSHKRKASSPSRELNMKKPEKGEKSEKGGSSAGGASKNGPASPKETREKRRSNSFTANPDEQIPPKRGPGRPRKEDRLPTIAIPDRESPPLKKQSAKAKRTESDLNAMSSEGETVKPRRKLISGKDLKGEREKQRRASMVSTTSSMKEPPSPRDTRDEPSEKSKSEKFRDRTKQLKRDESRDRRSVSGEVSGKRHRSSATPPRASSEKEGNEAPVKRRRLDVDGKEKRLKTNPSAEDRSQKPVASRDGPAKIRKDKAKDGDKDKDKPLDDEDRKEPPAKSRKTEPAPGHGRRESAKSVSTEKSIHVKSEDPDVEMRDVDRPDEVDARALKAQKEEEKKKKAEAAVLEAKRKEEEKRRAEEERRKADEELEKKRRQEEDMRRREEEAQRKLKEEEERQRKEKEEERKRKEEEEEQRRLKEEEARKRREEEERQRVEQEEKRRKAEEEARRIREEEERKRQQEEERKRQEEEDRLRKEQLEREAAEQARRKKEEEERKEQERLRELERQREVERRRAAREAEQRRLFEEQEAARLAKLPPLLQWLDGSPQPKTNQFAQKLSTMQGVRYDCIRPEATGSPEGREQWVLNTQVALLLGEKDLQLSRYTAWERIPVSRIAKIMIWRLEADRYSLTSPNLYDIGSQLPSYYCGEDPERLSYKTIEKLRSEAREKFLEMDMFFVKASDLMFIVPTIPHLRDLKLTLAYRELPEDESLKWQSAQKWKIDPDANRFFGFAPGNKHYINGELVHEQRPGLSAVSKTPFPERRVPRRGLATVSPDDPEYVRLCKEQGLDHLLDASTCTSTSSPSPLLPNGVSSSPTAAAAGRPDHFPSHGASGDFLGDRSPRTTAPPLVNGNGNGIIYPSSTITGSIANNVAAEVKQNPPPLVNGINGSTTTNGSDS